MNKKQIIIGSVIAVLTFALFTGGTIFALTQNKSKETELISEDRGSSPKKTEKEKTIEKQLEDATKKANDETTAPGVPENLAQVDDTTQTNYITKRLEGCKEPHQGTVIGYMEIVYPDYVTLDKAVEGECAVTLSYKKGILSFYYTAGEAYPFNINENYTILKSENNKTLVRAYDEFTNSIVYTKLYTSSTDCEESPLYLGLRPPCGIGGNPFVTTAGNTIVKLDASTTDQERDEILKVFDDINIRSSSGAFNTAQ